MATLPEVRQRIDAARARSSFGANVDILAVSKGQDSAAIERMINCGHTLFGENYVDEAEEKISRFPAVRWHFIGTIQRNKCKRLVALFDTVQTVSRESEALMLDRAAGDAGRTLGVMVQFDPKVEATKHGASEEEITALAQTISTCAHLSLAGMMMIAPNIPPQGRRPYFQKARKLFEALRSRYPSCMTLSMGMSDDFEIAIEEGATMVRIGTLLFGPRQNKTG